MVRREGAREERLQSERLTTVQVRPTGNDVEERGDVVPLAVSAGIAVTLRDRLHVDAKLCDPGLRLSDAERSDRPKRAEDLIESRRIRAAEAHDLIGRGRG